MRDLTKTQFLDKLSRYNIRPSLMGYFDITSTLAVYGGAGTRRATLAYLLERQRAELGKEGKP